MTGTAASATDPRRNPRVKHLHLLFLLAVASPLLAFWPSAQDPTETDWDKEVDRACTASRYGLRLAASRKIAQAGAAAVPALRKLEAGQGRAAVPALLAESIADANTTDDAVVDLLVEWATDRDFYWRGQAMRGLAGRAADLPKHRPALERLFRDYADDDAWLTRVHARFGLAMLDDATALQRTENDPRATPRLIALLLAKGRQPPLQPLLDALGDERTFLGDPWGKRLGQDANRALRQWLGDDYPGNGEGFDDKGDALAQLTEAARKKSGQDLRLPVVVNDPDLTFVGGFEILSCKTGDKFVRWTADGALHFGLDASTKVALDAAAWQKLSKDRAVLQLDETLGVVVCDSMRIQWQEPATHSKIAPHALPAAASDWLKHLADAIEESKASTLAEALRTGLAQFSPR